MADALTPARGPRVICNPATGERIVIRTSGAETRGALLAFDVYLPPGGHVPARHAHPNQEERFTVLDGELEFRVGRHTVTARRGDVIRVPPRTAHWFGNRSAAPACAAVEVRPALRMEALLFSSEQLGACDERRPLQRLARLARFLAEFEGELAVPLLPRRLVRAAAMLTSRDTNS